MILLLLYMAASILAVFFLIQLGGVIQIITALLMLMGLIFVGGALMGEISDIHMQRMKKEKQKNESAGDIQ